MKTQVKNVPIKDVHESKTNPRGEFEKEPFGELVASIREMGVLQPIVVRKVAKGYEAVAGNLRLRAAKEAGFTEITATVFESMTDVEAREIQIVENLQRAEIHPMDEGDSYRKLIEESGYGTHDVAARVGKSEDYVKARLVLTNLSGKIAGAYRKGEMRDGHATLIARLTEKSRSKHGSTRTTDGEGS